MALTNQAKPSTTLTNIFRVLGYETWASMTATWAAETRTWEETGSFFDNVARPVTSVTNVAKP